MDKINEKKKRNIRGIIIAIIWIGIGAAMIYMMFEVYTKIN